MLKFVPDISICERYTILDFYVFIMEGGILTVYHISAGKKIVRYIKKFCPTSILTFYIKKYLFYRDIFLPSIIFHN